jgi:hypothetical protein
LLLPLNDDCAINGADDAPLSAAIVIPAFNAVATIAEMLRSVQACPDLAKMDRV